MRDPLANGLDFRQRQQSLAALGDFQIGVPLPTAQGGQGVTTEFHELPAGLLASRVTRSAKPADQRIRAAIGTNRKEDEEGRSHHRGHSRYFFAGGSLGSADLGSTAFGPAAVRFFFDHSFHLAWASSRALSSAKP